MLSRRALAALVSAAVAAGVAVAVADISPLGAVTSAAPSGFPLAFGNDSAGQVGSGVVNNGTLLPTATQLPAGVTASQVAPGYAHTVALGSDGGVYAWGANDHGQLGNGTKTASPVPKHIMLPAGVTVSSVAAGYLDSYAVTTAGKVYAWGYGGSGQLGNGANTDALAPVLVSLPAQLIAKAVSVGYWHTLAVTSDGSVYSWGINTSGELGDGTQAMRTTPVKAKLPTGTTATAVSAGYAHSLALTSAGKVLAWGANDHGQLGIGTSVGSLLPVAVGLGTATATSVAAGYLHSVATLTGGTARAWGDNSKGQLGTGQSAAALPKATTPVAVALSGATVTRAAAGFAHSLLLTTGGTVLATGDNTYGELGTGDTIPSNAPVATALPANPGAFAVATSSFSLTSFTIVPAAATTVTLKSSAANSPGGQAVTFTAAVAPSTGIGTVSFTSGNPATPLPGCSALPLRKTTQGSYVATCSTANLPVGTTAIGASYSGGAQFLAGTGTLAGGQVVHAVAGVVVGWGGNSSGQLGDGSTTDRPAPVSAALPVGSQAVQVVGGADHGLALMSDGSVYAWGDNTFGELGDGTTTNSNVPVHVTLPSGVVPVSVAAGAFTSALVTTDGKLYTWGLNNAGQLGDGTTTDHPLPQPATLPAGTVVTAASLGGAHLLALTATGVVYAAGGNNAGQLGNNSIAPAATPVVVLVAPSVTPAGISAGSAHSLAVTTDGTVLAWGDNTHGELGTGVTTPAVLPVAAKTPAGTTVTAVSAGYYDSFALTSTGSALGWGDNEAGELGNDGTTDSHLPIAVQTPAGSHLTSVWAAGKSAYGLTDAGTVLGWGDNSSGSVGDGTTTPRLTPVPVVLPPGTHAVAIGAGGSGIAGYALAPRVTSTTSVTSSSNPSTIGTSVTFTAAVGPADGGGTVVFTADGSPITGCEAVALDGAGAFTATCSTPALGGGNHAIAAAYSGDVLYTASSGTLSGGQTVNLLPTTTKVVTSAAKVAYTKPVIFTATVTGSDGSGTVAFASDGVTIAGCSAAPLATLLGSTKAKCTTSALSPGNHVITAGYSGGTRFASSSATLSGGELVTAATKLVANAVTITDPQGLTTYSATLTVQADNTPVAGMTVTFTLNALYGTSTCSATTDSSGVATCQGARPKRTGGQYTAKFGGTDVYLASSGTSTVKF